MKRDFIFTLYSTTQTVFSLKELSLLFPDIPYNNLKSKAHYFVKKKKFQNPRKGIYAKENYNKLELASKIYTPSYISLETVLQKEGIIFQNYETIFVVSYLSRKISVDKVNIFYRKIGNHILLNKEGINEVDNYAIAIKERAFLDAIFLYKDYHFDNLSPLDWETVRKLKVIYQSKALEKRVEDYYQIYISENVKQDPTPNNFG